MLVFRMAARFRIRLVLAILIIAGPLSVAFPPVPQVSAASNLLTNPGAETGNASGWTTVLNGGNGMAFNWDGIIRSGSYSFQTSYAVDSVKQTVDLLANGYSAAQLDAQPDITCTIYTATRAWGGQYYITYKLLAADGVTVIASSGFGSSNSLLSLGGDDPWTARTSVFQGYGTGVRYVYVEFGGKDVLGWGGNYGTHFDDASVTVNDDAPAVSSLSPADNGTGASIATNLTITFNQVTRAGTGTLTIKKASDDSEVETIAVSGALLSGNGTTELTFDPSTTLAGNTGYYVTWTANAFKNAFGKHTAAQTSSTYWNFTTVDTTPPSVSALSPADGATNVSTGANLVLTFDKATRAGTGTLTIKKSSDNSTVEIITVSGAFLSGNGTTELTLNPSTTLAESTAYYVVWTANAFKNTSGNHTAAQEAAAYWNFTTGDFTAPSVTTLSPADGATDVSATANLVITFNEIVRAGTGTLTIKKSSDNSTVEIITVSGAFLSGNGTTELTLNPSTTLAESTAYYVVWTANAFKDVSENRNHAAALASATAWNFTALGIPPVLSDSASSATNSGATITWTTDESGSSLLQYGLTSALGSATTETDTTTRVLSHSVTLSGLPACTTFFYRPLSSDASGNTGTGSASRFTTTACTNSAAVGSQTGSSIGVAGGSLDMTNGGSGTSLTVPPNAATNGFALQIKKLNTSTVLAATSTPAGATVIGDQTYDIRAISGSTLVTSFLEPITVTMTYTDAQMSGYTESSLWIYRWDGTAWNALTGCTVDTDANTVSCTTTHFSTFGLFGEEAAAPTAAPAVTPPTSGGAGGRRGSDEGMGTRINNAYTTIFARFAAAHPTAQENHPSTPAVAQDSGGGTERGSGTQIVRRPSSSTSQSKIVRNRNHLVAVVDDRSVIYRDVPLDAWYAPFVATLVEDGVATGYVDTAGKPTGEFGVNNPVTFAEVLKMALEAARTDLTGSPPPRNRSAQDSWASAYVGKAEALQLTVFKPSLDINAPASRGAVVQTVLEVLHLPIASQSPAFSDVPAGHPYAKAIATAAFYGLVGGDTDAAGNATGTFRPDDTISRAEVAKIIALVKEVMGK